jgi:benzoyl-CoA reductase/2-hydroxyglutaryl-CoA dehydratase subunit BcrC/BadD/HgdB
MCGWVPEAVVDLRQVYADRLQPAREAQAGGQRIVGLVGQTIPAELVLAVGRWPVQITAERGAATPTAEQYMEGVSTPETRALFELAVSGALEFLDLLILSRPYAHLYYYLKEVVRLGRGSRVPPLHMYDLMQSQRPAVRAYNWGRTQHLIERLERLADRPITEPDLWRMIDVTNRQRAVQRQIQQRRWAGELSGVEALQILGASAFLPPSDYLASATRYLAERLPDPGLGHRPRVLVATSEPLTYPDLHQALEATGALVVAEDDWWGARMAGADVPLAGSAREAVFQKVWLDTPSAGVYPAAAREAWFWQHAQRSDVDAVVFFVPPSDHQFGWVYPRLRDGVAEIGKPQLLLRQDATDPHGRASIEAAASEFVARLATHEGGVSR